MFVSRTIRTKQIGLLVLGCGRHVGGVAPATVHRLSRDYIIRDTEWSDIFDVRPNDPIR